MKEKLIALLTFTSSLKSFGMKFIRVAILVVFVWIGGLKYFHYEADGIVPFVANSPFMSFFYAKGAPEYKNIKMRKVLLSRKIVHGTKQPHLYFLLRTGSSYYGDRHTGIPGNLFPKSGIGRRHPRHYHDARHTFFSCHHPEVWVPDLGSGEFGFPLLSGAGRLVIKDIVILASAVVLLSDSSQTRTQNT